MSESVAASWRRQVAIFQLLPCNAQTRVHGHGPWSIESDVRGNLPTAVLVPSPVLPRSPSRPSLPDSLTSADLRVGWEVARAATAVREPVYVRACERVDVSAVESAAHHEQTKRLGLAMSNRRAQS